MYKALKEIHLADGSTIPVGKNVKDELVTRRMIELEMVQEVQDVQEEKIEEISVLNEVITETVETLHEELLIDDSSSVEVHVQESDEVQEAQKRKRRKK